MEIASETLREFDLFKPESALKNPWRANDGPFELTEFEELVADVSSAVVVFPEAPGSYCETGYFTARDGINRKTLLVINRNYQADDSFISTGPVHRVNRSSDFRPTLYIDYQGNFEEVITRLKKRSPASQRKSIGAERYKDLSKIEKMALIQKTVELLRIATFDDLKYMFRSMFGGKIIEKELFGLTAILRGSNYLFMNDPYGHFSVNEGKARFLEIRSGHQGEETQLKLEIAEILEGNKDFSDLLMVVRKC